MTNSRYTRLEFALLESLSFYDPQTLAQIVLGMKWGKEEGSASYGELQECLQALEKAGQVRSSPGDQGEVWRRTHPPRGFWERCKRWFSTN